MRLRRLLCRSRFLVACILFLGSYIAVVLWTSNMKSEGRGDNSVDGFINVIDKNSDMNKGYQKAGNHPILQSNGYKKKAYHSHTECKEKKNLVFIKCMKCATETMATIIRRFGYERNLSFVTPYKDKLYLGWPYLMTKYDYRPSSRGYNIVMEHAIYNKSFLENLMPSDTVYISIIREPFSHVKSTIHYFNLINIARVPGNDPLSEYFHHIEKYDAVYKHPESRYTRYCIPNGFSITKNLLSHCLGMPVGFPHDRGDISHDQTAVQHYIEQLGQDFSLIMLVEYFHESLILLKRKMCWTFHDIIYKSVNGGKYSYKEAPADPELVSIYKNWSSADYALYDYFNKSFWRQVRDQGPDFFEEVAEYINIQTEVTHLCENGGEVKIGDSKWSPGFTMSRKDCRMIGASLLKNIQARHDRDEKVVLEKEDLVSLRHRPQALC